MSQPESKHSTAYRKDLAFIHDTGFSDFARKAGAGVLQLLSKHAIHNGMVVDLGCGSGVWARMLVDAGYAVHGIDISSAMIEICQKRIPEGQFEVGSLLEASLPSCNAVTSMGECLNYLFDPQNNLDAQRRLFNRVYEALMPGGVFVFDVIEPGYGAISGPPKRHMLGEDWAALVEVQEIPENHTLTRAITTFRKTGELYQRDEEVHHVQLYRGEDLEEALQEAGFTVERSRSYPDFQLSKAHSVLVAQKPHDI